MLYKGEKIEESSIYDERGISYKHNHTTINNGVIKDAEYFKNYFKKQKVELFILNKKSLLSKTLKLYKFKNKH